MIKYPLHFKGSAKTKPGMATPFEARAEDYATIPCAVPVEFQGPGGGYSPEDLYLLALATCFIATFKVFAERTKFVYEELSAEGTLTIDRNAQGVPELQKVELDFILTGAQDKEKAKTLLAESKKYCLVSNAVKSELVFNYQIKD
jgi:organic hydroperoxide reductase OsmC/OhrA